MKHLLPLALIAALAACGPNADAPTPAPAADIIVPMAAATHDGPGDAIGAIRIRNGENGAAFELDLFGLPEGAHGFHVHETADCSATHNGSVTPAGAAGGHWDPDGSGVHAGPEGLGHLGDLPRIEVGADGRAQATLIAPRIEDIERLRGRALMIHAGGDTYAEPPPLGGGGARIACGVIS